MTEPQHTNNIKNKDSGMRAGMLKVLFGVLIVAFTFLRIYHILAVGLTTSEADLLTNFGAMRTFSFPYSLLVISWNEPLTVMLMRLVALCGEPPVYGRYIFAFFGVWSLLLIAGIARRNSGLITALITVVFAGFSAALIVSSQEISKISLIIWAALIVQWAFSLLTHSPKRRNVVIYLVSALVGVLFSPLISFVILAHLIWFTIFAVQKKSGNSIRIAYIITATGSLIIALPFFILKWIALSKINIMGLAPVLVTTDTIPEITGNIKNLFFVHSSLILYYLFILVSVIAIFRSFFKKTRGACVWGTVVLLVSVAMLISPYKNMGKINNSILLPFVILLIVQGFIEVSEMIARLKGYAGKILKYCFMTLVTAVFVLWGFGQYKFYEKKQQSIISRDLSSPSEFLKRVVKPNDKIILVSDIDTYDWLRTKYYFCDYLTGEAKASFEQINKAEWQTNCLNYFPDENSSLWLVGVSGLGKDCVQNSYTNLTFSYALPVTWLIQTSKWNGFEYLNLLREANAATPMNHAITAQLLDWYKGSRDADLVKCVESGFAGKDIAAGSGSELFKKAAANRILYAWKECNITNFYKFNEFVNEVREFGIDNDRAIHLYSLYAEKALRSTNLIVALTAVESAKRIDPENPFINRLAAKAESLKKNKNLNKIVELNELASKEYRKRNGKIFIAAEFANAYAYRALSNYAKAFDSCNAILSYYSDGIKMPVSIQTNLTENGRIRREKWTNDRLAWIGRCNSFISTLLCETGDFENAILWETKNLDERNSEARRTTSRERLAKMYTKVGGIDKAFQYIDSLANSATSVNKRISWKIEGAQLYVTLGDTVSTYDKWNDLQKEIEKLPMEERWKWSKNKQYQRILRYLSSRSQMDIRNPVLVSIGKRAAKETNATIAAGLRIQMAGIYKCKLQYGQAEKMFKLAEKIAPLYFDSFLSDGILKYRMKRYAKAETVFTNITHAIKEKNIISQSTQDWRYIVLDMLVEKGTPPSLENVLARMEEFKPYIADVSEYNNYRGNILACYGKFDLATNQFTLGIQTNRFNLQNHLDLGYLICKHSNADEAGKIIDRIMSLDLPEKDKQILETDWRFIILHHVSVRPYNLKE